VVTGGITARGGASRLLLSGPPGFRLERATATARLHLAAGQSVNFALQHGRLSEAPLTTWDTGEIDTSLQDTVEGWRSWSAIPGHQSYQGPWRDLVLHSGLVLQALTFQPTGAIVAAPTTSLPETIGGERNWDYRYTWVRDASLTMDGLWVAACPHEAGKFFGFLADAAAAELRRGSDLQIMFGVGGEHDLSERELTHAIAARLVYRYLAHDGLTGEEGSFLLCTFWLAHAQALAGELDQATTTFGRAIAAINDVGLLAEEVHPASGEMIGNFPQAFSHIGLINAAWAIAQAQERAAAQTG
jgi:GH15 family glucan-1,4-alpha-glucosidase